jgi:mannose-6-phosphate isomerase-like protein (cupin superfamily)
MRMNLLTEAIDLKSTDKLVVFNETEKYLGSLEFHIVQKDQTRPWGGFFVINENQAEYFADLFFPGIQLSTLYKSGKLSPKILLVAPHKRLSWQYHHRRAEVWRVLAGKVSVVTSHSDEEHDVTTLTTGETIFLEQGERHRLVGMQEWGVVAEIWQHTDGNHPSDEEDIIRLQDDFGR